MNTKTLFLFFFQVLICRQLVYAQASALSPYVRIDTITLEGNYKTRKSLILRELEFAVGDSIPSSELSATLERNRLRLLNTNLFTTAELSIREGNDSNQLALHIRLTETWFIIPVPLFELADRNFNVWWKEYKGSFRRVNYGFDLSHNNLTGAADVLKMKMQFGYNNRYEISYRFPPLDTRQTLSLQTAVAYSRVHEVAYQTLENKLQFLRDDNEWMFVQFSAVANLSWRPRLLNTHNFSAEYRDSRVADSVAFDLNPDFFLQSSNRQTHFSLLYNFNADHRDIRPYPLRGWLAILELRQNGISPTDDLHLFRAFAEYRQYISFSSWLSLEAIGKVRVSLPRNRPPYFNNPALGYGGNFVRGYEYYVADGLDFGVLKTAVHVQLFNRTFQLGRLMPFKAFKELPLKIYLALNNDVGYANDPYYAYKNPLSNHVLYGYGLGLDVIAWYNKTARFEWSWNDLGQGGFFVRIDTGF